jgi:hypothetical protein
MPRFPHLLRHLLQLEWPLLTCLGDGTRFLGFVDV